ncbi:MAG: Pr6Pr family membrane protein [Chloroflexia bacterium]|nr:Pr6Pr family membrane protein [Chloroflexia bacterium]
MTKHQAIATYRVIFAVLTLGTITYQFLSSRDDNADFRASNFFSFFTIESNILASVVFLAAARSISAATSVGAVSPGRSSLGFDLLRGAAVVYMATTGIVYGLLLSGYQEELQTTIPWVDTVVHRLMPLVVVADWFIAPPAHGLSWRRASVWLIYPALYMVYSLVRGPIVDWYPYPFLDPGAAGGVAGVAVACVGIALGIAAMSALVAWVSRRPSPATATH